MKWITLFLMTPTLCFAMTPPNGANHMVCDNTETHCIAVGRVDEGPNEKCPFGCQQLVAFYLSNGVWENATFVPQPKSKLGNLNALSCSEDIKHCVAVGYQMLSHHSFDKTPFIMSTHNAGHEWNANSHPLGETFCLYGDFPYSALNAVHCDDLGNHCVAVGFCKSSVQNKDYSFETRALSVISEEGGIHFKDSNTQPIPQGYNNELQKIECDDQLKKCLATGFSSHKNSRWETRFYSWNHGNDWQIVD